MHKLANKEFPGVGALILLRLSQQNRLIWNANVRKTRPFMVNFHFRTLLAKENKIILNSEIVMEILGLEGRRG